MWLPVSPATTGGVGERPKGVPHRFPRREIPSPPEVAGGNVQKKWGAPVIEIKPVLGGTVSLWKGNQVLALLTPDEAALLAHQLVLEA